MTLGDRINTVITERKIKQIDFAKELGISANYVNQLVNNKKANISETLAKLIEETYGYSANWILYGDGEKTIDNYLSTQRAEILKRMRSLDDHEIKALLAFIKSLTNKDD